jgi:hypothetical protein
MSGTAQRRARLWRRAIGTLALFGIIALAVIYGPRLASGNYHRAAIERLASDAVGRQVRITGPIELALVPDPQLRAQTVTIGGPGGATVRAETLKLDLAPLPLLLGRLRARKLTLRKPQIDLPWPLPGGARAVAPPPWLASLHATIVDGTFHLGRLTLTHADLSIFTGGPNAVVAASGSVTIAGLAGNVTLDIDDTGGRRPAPVTATIGLAGGATLGFKGTLDRASHMRGVLTAMLPQTAIDAIGHDFGDKSPLKLQPLDATAQVIAEDRAIELAGIAATIGAGGGRSHFTGDALIDLDPAPMLRLDMTGDHAALDDGTSLLTALGTMIPTAAALKIDRLDLPVASAVPGLSPPSVGPMRATVVATAAGLSLASLQADLPGDAVLSVGRHGSHRFTFTAPAPAITIAALHPALPVLPYWPSGLGRLMVAGSMTTGTASGLALDDLQGQVGGKATGSSFTGAIHLSAVKPNRARIAAAIGFKTLKLDARTLTALIAARAGSMRLSGPVRLSAGAVQVMAGRAGDATPLISGTDLVLDGALRPASAGGGLALRFASVRLGRAMMVGHGTIFGNGSIGAARLMLSGADATRTLTALNAAFAAKTPPWIGLSLWHRPFALAAAAAGKLTALHTGVSLHLGDLRIGARPVVDLLEGTASGPLSLRAPRATTLLREIGGASLLSADHGLTWPGPGSISLRARFFAAGAAIGLPDFVLSFAALTASGQIAATIGAHPHIVGSIAADTLPLPAADRLLAIADAALGSNVDITLPTITATLVAHGQDVVVRDARFGLRLDQGRIARVLGLTLAGARIEGGQLDGTLTLTGAATHAPPTLSATGHLVGVQGARLASLAAANGVAWPLNGEAIDLGGTINAIGATQADWAKTLTGSLTASGKDMTVAGIDLAATDKALRRVLHDRVAAPDESHPVSTDEAAPDDPAMLAGALHKALTGGSTSFDTANATAHLAGPVLTLGSTDMTGPAGTLGLSGTLDLAHRTARLVATATPSLTGHGAPPGITIRIAGPMARPAASIALGPVMQWSARAPHDAPHTVKPPVTPPHAP